MAKTKKKEFPEVAPSDKVEVPIKLMSDFERFSNGGMALVTGGVDIMSTGKAGEEAEKVGSVKPSINGAYFVVRVGEQTWKVSAFDLWEGVRAANERYVKEMGPPPKEG